MPHQLEIEEAKRRIQGLIADARKQFGHQVSDVREQWNGDRNDFGFRALGMAVDGCMEVEPGSVNIRLNLPLAALPLKGKIEQKIEENARTLLA